MSSKKFVKDLSPDEQVIVLDFILDKFTLDKNEKSLRFYQAMVGYIKNVRRSLETFKKNVDEIIDLLVNLGFENDEIMMILEKEPSLLHANKNDIFWRYLILDKVIDSRTLVSIREHMLIENPRLLRTSQDIMYARIKYLESPNGKVLLRKNKDHLTARQILKITHDEFEKSYGVGKQWLLENYPFDNDAQLDVIEWDGNKALLSNIYGRKI